MVPVSPPPTQTAERAYRANAGPAHVRVAHDVGAGCWLDWLPQETILFDRSDLDRDTHIRLAPDAGCLLLESVVLGRAAMGEEVRALHLRDHRRITRGGVPVFLEPMVFGHGHVGPSRPKRDLGRRARLCKRWFYARKGAGDALGPVRAALSHGTQAAASAYDGKLVIRLLAADGWPLRRQIPVFAACVAARCPAAACVADVTCRGTDEPVPP